MGDVVLTIQSEREGGQATLTGVSSNLDGSQSIQWDLPVGFGDCYVIRPTVYVSQIATAMATPGLFGVMFWQTTAAGAIADIWGQQRWIVVGGSLVAAYQPLLAVLWRESESVSTDFDEVDINATPTADVRLSVLVHRRQNMPMVVPQGSDPGPIFTS